MATPPRPPSRLPDRRVNPEYTAWRKKYVLKDGLPATAPETLTLRVIGGARNTNFVRCALGNGDAVHARIRKGAASKLMGKSIRVQVTEEDGETKYTHLP